MTTTVARRQRGFSLIEIIAALVLLGILAATVFGFMGQAVRGFFISRDALEITQKAQIALNRMRIELTYLKSVSAASDTSLTFVSDISGSDTTYTIAYDGGGNRITWNTVTLIDDVASANGLTLQYRTGVAGVPDSSYADGDIIDITLNMRDSDGSTVTFTTSVFPGKITP
ncbi:MAG: type II secretion system protein [Desulfovibrionaceae bacterium]|nr:type II secretion system protein [Desulfovibrionaceae bacterium]